MYLYIYIYMSISIYLSICLSISFSFLKNTFVSLTMQTIAAHLNNIFKTNVPCNVGSISVCKTPHV